MLLIQLLFQNKRETNCLIGSMTRNNSKYRIEKIVSGKEWILLPVIFYVTQHPHAVTL